MTNEEKIKNMSTEELAKFLDGISPGYYCGACPVLKICYNYGRTKCVKKLFEWLKEEAE